MTQTIADLTASIKVAIDGLSNFGQLKSELVTITNLHKELNNTIQNAKGVANKNLAASAISDQASSLAALVRQQQLYVSSLSRSGAGPEVITAAVNDLQSKLRQSIDLMKSLSSALSGRSSSGLDDVRKQAEDFNKTILAAVKHTQELYDKVKSAPTVTTQKSNGVPVWQTPPGEKFSQQLGVTATHTDARANTVSTDVLKLHKQMMEQINNLANLRKTIELDVNGVYRIQADHLKKLIELQEQLGRVKSDSQKQLEYSKNATAVDKARTDQVAALRKETSALIQVQQQQQQQVKPTSVPSVAPKTSKDKFEQNLDIAYLSVANLKNARDGLNFFVREIVGVGKTIEREFKGIQKEIIGAGNAFTDTGQKSSNRAKQMAADQKAVGDASGQARQRIVEDQQKISEAQQNARRQQQNQQLQTQATPRVQTQSFQQSLEDAKNALGGFGGFTQDVFTALSGGANIMLGVVSGVFRKVKEFYTSTVSNERTLGPIRELFVNLSKFNGENAQLNFDTQLATMAKYGLAIDSLSIPLARLKIATQNTTLGGERFKSFMEDFASVGAKFAMPQESIAGMAKAFEQMISKGTVQAEEFRQQLGDRLPGALKVGLETWREMTGKVEGKGGSALDFFTAMKNKQIESTRFIEIFMLKLKEMYGITNDPPKNLNASFGMLNANVSIALEKIDQASYSTQKFRTVLDALSSALKVVQENARLFGGGVLLAEFSLIAGAFALITGSAGGALLKYFNVALPAATVTADRAIKATTSALVAVGQTSRVAGAAMTVVAPFAGVLALALGRLGTGFEYLLRTLRFVGPALAAAFSLPTVVKKISDYFTKPADDAQKTGQAFVLNLDKTIGDGLANAKGLSESLTAYIVANKAAVKTNKLLTLDFDIGAATTTAIDGIFDKLSQGAAKRSGVESLVKDQKDEIKKLVSAAYEGNTDLVAADKQLKTSLEELRQNFMARYLNSIKTEQDSAQRLFKDYRSKYLAEELKVGFDRIALLKKQSAEATRIQKENNEGVKNLAPPVQDLGVFATAIRNASRFYDEHKQKIDALVTAYGGFVAIRWIGMVAGLGDIAAGLTTVARSAVVAKAGIVAATIALAAFLASGPSKADQATSGMSILRKEVEELQRAMQAGPLDAAQQAGAANTIKSVNSYLNAFREEQTKLRQAEEDAIIAKREFDRRYAGSNDVSITFSQTQNTINKNFQETAEKAAAGKANIEFLEGTLKLLSTALQNGAIDAKGLSVEIQNLLNISGGASAPGAPKVLDAIGPEIARVRREVEQIKKEGYKAYEQLQVQKQLAEKYGTGESNSIVKATDAEIKELARLTRAREDALKASRKPPKKDGMTSERADQILTQVDSLTNNEGAKQARLLRQNEKLMQEAAAAMKFYGYSSKDTAKNLQELNIALQLQAQGINLASLQMQPLQAMQRGFEGFIDSFADALSKGTLNAKSFGEMFRNMAQSIVKDIVAMSLKSALLKPFMTMLGGGNAAAGGGGNPFAFLGNLFGGATQNAKGDVFGSKAYFLGNGKMNSLAESGPEAVMPLRRGPNGALGVQVHGETQKVAPQYNITFHVSTPNAESFRKSEAQMGAMLRRTVGRGSRNE
jgi:hypothetical protein